ncbi:MAG: glycosyltransferase family 8 protein [Janthinobacterium lividum]
MGDKILNIAIAFDNNYLSPVYALLTSVFENNTGSHVNIHSIVSGITTLQKEELIAYVKKYGATIYYYKLDYDFSVLFKLNSQMWWTESIFYRLLFPIIVPEHVDKLLYLDTDIIVLKNLAELYSTDMGEMPVAAVRDFVDYRPELGICSLNSYFNSGVLLISRKKWIEQDITTKALSYIKDNADKLLFPDQDALNAVLLNNWVKLSTKFNVMFKDIPADLSKSQIKLFLEDIVILHYTSQHKPWSILGKNRLRFLYRFYLWKAPVLYRIRYTDFVWNRHKLREALEIRLTEMCTDYPWLSKAINKK